MKTSATKTTSTFFQFLWKSIKMALLVLFVTAALAFFAAPSFFGIVVITSGVIFTVLAYTVLGFLVSAVFNWPFKGPLSLWREYRGRKSEEAHSV